MCERAVKPDGSKESWFIYAWRYSIEAFTNKPASFMAVFSCLAMLGMYYCEQQTYKESRAEYREFIKEQTQVMIEVSKQLIELNTRIQLLEKK